jgi:hypothetical protein
MGVAAQLKDSNADDTFVVTSGMSRE